MNKPFFLKHQPSSFRLRDPGSSPSPQTARARRHCLLWILLLVFLGVGLFLDINAGYADISLSQMAEIFSGGGSQALRYTLLELRLPRVLTSVLVGIGLSLSGCIIQGVTRNEMAEPGILGLNAGGGLFIALFVVLFSGTIQGFGLLLPLLAFAGSLSVALIEYRLAFVHGKLKPKRLLLIGVAIASAITALSTMLMLRMPDSDYAFVQNWLAGNIWGASPFNVVILSLGLSVLGLYVFYKSRTLNILVLGEESAIGLGVPIQKESLRLLGAAVAMSSLCCAVGGGLSFVGLVCPHLARKLFGPDYRPLIPASALCGAVLLVYSDIISRTFFLPNEIPVGIVCAVLGAPYFLYLLVKD